MFINHSSIKMSLSSYKILHQLYEKITDYNHNSQTVTNNNKNYNEIVSKEVYSNIIKTNNYLKEKMLLPDTNPNVIEMSLETLQHSIAMISSNKIKGVAPMAQRSGRPLQCISGRIYGVG